jgi:hypothetical protein
MSAQNNLSPKQFHVFRGLQTPASGVQKHILGVHWTDNPDVAEDFGSGKGLGGYASHRASYKGPYSVIHATTTKNAVERNPEKLQSYDIAMDAEEDEIPLKENAKVKVHSITTVHPGKRERMRKYNPPRTMTT